MTLDQNDTAELALPRLDHLPPAISPRRDHAVATPTVVPSGPTEGRRALREARRRRRRLALVCAAVLAACLLMTVLVLGMARDRPAPIAPLGAVVALPPQGQGLPLQGQESTVPSVEVARSSPSAVPSTGAPAPKGGHP